MSTALASQNETPPAPAGTGARKLTERAFRIRESGIIVVLVVFVAVTASVQPRFLNITNIQFILVNTTVFALLALGETMVVISRNYDLSVGSVLGLSASSQAGLLAEIDKLGTNRLTVQAGQSFLGLGAQLLAPFHAGEDAVLDVLLDIGAPADEDDVEGACLFVGRRSLHGEPVARGDGRAVHRNDRPGIIILLAQMVGHAQHLDRAGESDHRKLAEREESYSAGRFQLCGRFQHVR